MGPTSTVRPEEARVSFTFRAGAEIDELDRRDRSTGIKRCFNVCITIRAESLLEVAIGDIFAEGPDQVVPLLGNDNNLIRGVEEEPTDRVESERLRVEARISRRSMCPMLAPIFFPFLTKVVPDHADHADQVIVDGGR